MRSEAIPRILDVRVVPRRLLIHPLRKPSRNPTLAFKVVRHTTTPIPAPNMLVGELVSIPPILDQHPKDALDSEPRHDDVRRDDPRGVVRDDVRQGHEPDEPRIGGILPGADAHSHRSLGPRLEKYHPVVHRLRPLHHHLVPFVIRGTKMNPLDNSGECFEREMFSHPMAIFAPRVSVDILRNIKWGRHRGGDC